MDNRYTTIRTRLESLSDEELQRILNGQNILCTDTFNYDEQNKTYCMIALALGLDLIQNPTNNLITDKIKERFNPVNIIKGVEGEFYTTNRKLDIILLCKHILELRSMKSQIFELLEAACEHILFDDENQVPVCHCCGMELERNGEGHKSDCLANKILKLK